MFSILSINSVDLGFAFLGYFNVFEKQPYCLVVCNFVSFHGKSSCCLFGIGGGLFFLTDGPKES